MSGFDLVIIETAGIGQSDTEIIEHSNMSLYIMTPEFGAASHSWKKSICWSSPILLLLINLISAVHLDALRDVKKQYKRNHNLWEAKDEDLPVYGTIASQFNDPGTEHVYTKR